MNNFKNQRKNTFLLYWLLIIKHIFELKYNMKHLNAENLKDIHYIYYLIKYYLKFNLSIRKHTEDKSKNEKLIFLKYYIDETNIIIQSLLYQSNRSELTSLITLIKNWVETLIEDFLKNDICSEDEINSSNDMKMIKTINNLSIVHFLKLNCNQQLVLLK